MKSEWIKKHPVISGIVGFLAALTTAQGIYEWGMPLGLLSIPILLVAFSPFIALFALAALAITAGPIRGGPSNLSSRTVVYADPRSARGDDDGWETNPEDRRIPPRAPGTRHTHLRSGR